MLKNDTLKDGRDQSGNGKFKQKFGLTLIAMIIAFGIYLELNSSTIKLKPCFTSLFFFTPHKFFKLETRKVLHSRGTPWQAFIGLNKISCNTRLSDTEFKVS
jgi:hypothetical protein